MTFLQLKLRPQVATEQEKVIGEKEAELKGLKEEVEAKGRELRRADDEKQRLEERNQELEQRLRDSEKIIKTNENGTSVSDVPVSSVQCKVWVLSSDNTSTSVVLLGADAVSTHVSNIFLHMHNCLMLVALYIQT